MKKWFFALLGLATIAHAQVYLYDDFSGPSINSARWSIILPQAGASVAESNGSVTTTSRGILGSVAQFTAPYVVTGVFTMQSSIEHLNIVLRSNLSSPGASSFYDRAGVIVEFAMDGQGYSISNYTSAATNATLATAAYPFLVGKPYSYTITDSGTSISVAINGGIALTAQTSFSTGQQIGFYSREILGCSSRLDAVSVSAPAATVTVTPTPTPVTKLINMSTLGSGGFSMGFTISGSSAKSVLLRTDGPALKAFGLPGTATQTSLTLYSQASGAILGTNSSWGTASNASSMAAAFTSVGAFSLATGSADSALLVTLNPGVYSAQTSGNGTVLLEIYDANP